MQLVERALQKFHGVITGDQIDWKRFLQPEDKARVIPASELAEKGMRRVLLGPEHEEGLRLPWPKMNDKVLVRPGKLVVWAGWTHHGKTQMVKQAMLSRDPAIRKAAYSVDGRGRCRRLERSGCHGVRQHRAESRPVKRFIEFVTGNLWLYDQQGMVEPKKLQAIIRFAASELKVTQVVVDSLMMLAVDRDDYEAQARFVGELKTTAKDTGVTIHLVAHMRKRDGKGGDENPGTLHDISGGHEIASKADAVFIVWRDKKPGATPSCILKVDKQRGRVNWVGNVGLNYHATSRQFVEDLQPMSFWNDAENF
jgi:twinkle protein